MHGSNTSLERTVQTQSWISISMSSVPLRVSCSVPEIPIRDDVTIHGSPWLGLRALSKVHGPNEHIHTHTHAIYGFPRIRSVCTSSSSESHRSHGVILYLLLSSILWLGIDENRQGKGSRHSRRNLENTLAGNTHTHTRL